MIFAFIQGLGTWSLSSPLVTMNSDGIFSKLHYDCTDWVVVIEMISFAIIAPCVPQKV